jgi:hypothetical protein
MCFLFVPVARARGATRAILVSGRRLVTAVTASTQGNRSNEDCTALGRPS